ncbi:sperm surface protein Sp17-like [Contarinia nasturtii]|uniref:sperm surface protein Sp17-like n=1 Tax=Contarinia nasturtii TaxID=265458 RepID=UPI0012D3C601|nr:sperm surface protein Sp17-like [Contarinia nasturtii]
MKNSQRITPKIPDGMVELMKNLAKSVLKEQPENIYVFAAEYFENLVRERDGSLNKGYTTFRKFDDENALQSGVDVCPRCNCILHPKRKDEEPIDDDSSPRIDDENALDMSVNGVAIKAVPRDGVYQWIVQLKMMANRYHQNQMENHNNNQPIHRDVYSI